MSNRLTYAPQIDSLRALAVAGVLFQHWFRTTYLGTWGVLLFFVISGYLITRSILAMKDAGAQLPDAARTFFVRRSLRLFPAYYLLLGLAAGLAIHRGLQSDWPWYALYLSNVLAYLRQAWIPLLPTWSLAVEEQFYLLWFFACMLLPPRRFLVVLAILIIAAPLSRAYFYGVGNPFGNYLLWANCDALALGALLCHMERAGRDVRPAYGACAALALLAVTGVQAFHPELRLALEALELWCVAAAAWVIVARARAGFVGWPGRILNSSVLAYLGRISYGIYLYHMLTPYLAQQVFRGLPVFWRVADTFAFHCVLTVGMAALSYHFFEAPIRYGRWRPASASG